MKVSSLLEKRLAVEPALKELFDSIYDELALLDIPEHPYGVALRGNKSVSNCRLNSQDIERI